MSFVLLDREKILKIQDIKKNIRDAILVSSVCAFPFPLQFFIPSSFYCFIVFIIYLQIVLVLLKLIDILSLVRLV